MLQLGLKAADLGLERPWVDLEQQVTFAHLGAFGERHLVDLTRDTGPHFDGFRRFQTPGELVPFVDRLLDHLGHGDLWSRRGLRGIGGFAASAERYHCKGCKWDAERFE